MGLVRAGESVDFRMRRARRRDFNKIREATLQTVWDDTPADERERLDRPSWERHFRERIEPYIRGDRTEAWVAEDDEGRLLGYLLLGAGGGFLTPERHGFIFDVWVAPEQRGKGLGKSLVAWAVNWARDQGYRKVKLEVAESNARARHIYEELGFWTERRFMGKVLEESKVVTSRHERAKR